MTEINVTNINDKRFVFMFGKTFITNYENVEEPYGLLQELPNCKSISFLVDFYPEKPKGQNKKLFFYCSPFFGSIPFFVFGHDSEKNFPELSTIRPIQTPRHFFVDWPDYFANTFLSSAVKTLSQPAEKIPFVDAGASDYAYSICRVLRWPKERKKATMCMKLIVAASIEKYYWGLQYSQNDTQKLPIEIKGKSALKIASNILATGKLNVFPQKISLERRE